MPDVQQCLLRQWRDPVGLGRGRHQFEDQIGLGWSKGWWHSHLLTGVSVTAEALSGTAMDASGEEAPESEPLTGTNR